MMRWSCYVVSEKKHASLKLRLFDAKLVSMSLTLSVGRHRSSLCYLWYLQWMEVFTACRRVFSRPEGTPVHRKNLHLLVAKLTVLKDQSTSGAISFIVF